MAIISACLASSTNVCEVFTMGLNDEVYGVQDALFDTAFFIVSAYR